MSNAWKQLQARNRRLAEEKHDAETADRILIQAYIPGLIATFLLYYSDEFRTDPLGQIVVLDRIRETVGQFAAATAATLAYWVIIGITMFGLYRHDRLYRIVAAAWLLWAWFAYAAYFLGDLPLAFGVGWVAALFSVKVFGALESAYMIMRERMFLGSRK